MAKLKRIADDAEALNISRAKEAKLKADNEKADKDAADKMEKEKVEA